MKRILVIGASGTIGSEIVRTGTSLVYSGYSWRGRSHTANVPANAVPDDPRQEVREVMWISPDQTFADGRWFWGGYDEFGIDAHLTRIGTTPMLAGAGVFSLQSPSSSELKIYGANFPADLKPADLDLGAGITVTRIVRRTPTVATIAVQVNPSLASGIRDISLGRSTAERAIAVYDKVAYIKTL